VVAFSYGKPVSTFPENALGASARSALFQDPHRDGLPLRCAIFSGLVEFGTVYFFRGGDRLSSALRSMKQR
jgi:hypothetical protein